MKSELQGATSYGAVNVCQYLLDEYQAGKYDTFEILIGDIQILLTETYTRGKKQLGLYKIKDIDLGEIVENGARIKVSNKEARAVDVVRGLDDLDIIKCDGCGVNLCNGSQVIYSGANAPDKYCSIDCAPQGVA